MSPEDKRLIGELITAKHQELKDGPERLVLIDHAMIGALLHLAKRSLPKRQYIPWLKEYTPIGQRQGARYMERMHKYFAGKDEREALEKAGEEFMEGLIAQAVWPLKPKAKRKKRLRSKV